MSKFFSLRLYLQGLKKSRLQGITIAGVVTALTALIPLVSLLTSRHYNTGYVPSVSMIGYGSFAIPLFLLLFFSFFFLLILTTVIHNHHSKSPEIGSTTTPTIFTTSGNKRPTESH